MNWTVTNDKGIKHYVVFGNDVVTVTRHMNHGVILSVTKTFEEDVKYRNVLNTVKTIVGLDNELFNMLSEV